MTQPARYGRQFNFAGWQASNPNSPPPGASIDAELNAVAAALNALVGNIALIQRDDTGLENASVGISQLDPSTLLLIGSNGFTVRGFWAAAVTYNAGDMFTAGGLAYLVILPHVAQVLASDITAGKVYGPILAGTGGGGIAGTALLYPNGVDDTAQIQAALTTGASVFLAPGVFIVSATLLVNTQNQHGQSISGAGSVAIDGTGLGRTVIRPTAAVSTVLLVDGTPFCSYIQNFSLNDFTIDMVNMTDVIASTAVNQVQAFDCQYNDIRIANFGINKTSWLFTTGAYTSKMENCQGGLIAFNGTNYANQTTSISLTNCDIYRIANAFFTNVTLIGGAVQQPYSASVPIVYLAPGTTPYGYLPNTAGLYAAVLTDLTNCYSFTSVGTDWEQGGGYPATYNDGTHGTLGLIRVVRVQATCLNTTFINPTFAGMYLLDYGLNTRVTGQALGQAAGIDITTGAQYNFSDTRSMGNILGIADFATYLDFGTGITFSINGSTGYANFNKTTVRPAADGDQVLYVKNASGLPLYDFTTNGAGFAMLSGTLISGYTDSFTTQSWIIDASTGGAKFRSLNITPAADGNSVVLWKNAGGTVLLGFNTNATPASSSLFFENGISLNGFSDAGSTQTWSANAATGNVTAKSIQLGATAPLTGNLTTNGQLRTVGITVAALPAAATMGNGGRGFVTDGSVVASGNFGAVVAGGGANNVPVYCDGSNWRIG